jgi:nucleoid DNA-binding protein
MNKGELIESVAKRRGLTKIRTKEIVDTVFEVMSLSLISGDKVVISDFGTFDVSERKAFDGQDPRTGAKIKVPKRRIATFKSGKGLKKAMCDTIKETAAEKKKKK